MTEARWPCPVCGYLVFGEPPGSYSICEVCNWEDDNIQRSDPDYKGGANSISLNEARQNYKKTGAISSEYLAYVRFPLEDEN